MIGSYWFNKSHQSYWISDKFINTETNFCLFKNSSENLLISQSKRMGCYQCFSDTRKIRSFIMGGFWSWLRGKFKNNILIGYSSIGWLIGRWKGRIKQFLYFPLNQDHNPPIMKLLILRVSEKHWVLSVQKRVFSNSEECISLDQISSLLDRFYSFWNLNNNFQLRSVF